MEQQFLRNYHTFKKSVANVFTQQFGIIGTEMSEISDGQGTKKVRVRFSAHHPREVFPSELTSDEEMERNLCEWPRMNVLYKCDRMNICTIKYQNKQNSGITPPNLGKKEKISAKN
jgi:hypothetical protein